MNNHIKKLSWDTPTEHNYIIANLKNNKVAAGTSDTVIGLLANATAEGFEALNNAKGRAEKSYIVLIANKAKLAHFVPLPLPAFIEKIIDHCWPGPLTLVLNARPSLPAHLKSPAGTIALRIPHHIGLLHLLKNFDGLFSTSANRAGLPVAKNTTDIDPLVLKHIAFLIDEKKSTPQEPLPMQASTILDATGPHVRILREGSYSQEQLETISGLTLE